MFTPQIIFCLAAQCYIGSGEPQPSLERCREHIAAVMIVRIRQAVPEARIQAMRCLPTPQDPET
jgi:hypothetical protein